MTVPTAAALLSASAAVLTLAAVRERFVGIDLAALGRARHRRLAPQLRRMAAEGTIDESFGGGRVLAGTLCAGAVAGFSLLGLAGVPLGMLAAPAAVRWALGWRRRRHAAQLDAGAAELAQALASSLAAGRSVRGALLTAAGATPRPLSDEIERVAIDLTLGRGTEDALAALRWRTGSSRVESLAGAISLHRGSGGDLVRLMRELAEAFRDRDRALRDARSASAQARFTAVVVAAIPLVVAVVLELTSAGAVSGALRLLPTALMLAVSASLMGFGVVLSRRIAAVRE